MTRAPRRTLALLAVAAITATLSPGVVRAAEAAAPAANDDRVVWLCRPGLVANPCEIPTDTTVLHQGAAATSSRPTRDPSAERPIDCFYVYPTVSNQLTLNATKARDPEVTSIARFQAARFSTQCRMFAPVYRQIPLAGILTALPASALLPFLPSTPMKIAYRDVVAAWQEYLTTYNRGRGVVLIGHSQGTIMLRKLIHDRIDGSPALRKRLVGAMLLGGNVLTAKGRATGGDFTNVPVCTRPGQAGCVVAFSTYASNPSVPFFGSSIIDVLSLSAGLPSGPKYRVACTDPAHLSGITRPVGVTIPSKPFAPGAISVGIQFSTLGKVPKAATTWVTSADRYRGGCRRVSGADVYRYDPTPGSVRPLEFPPTWGTHLFDVNLGLERLVRIVARQRASWLALR